MPAGTMNEWLAKEHDLGSEYPNRIVLATAGKNGIPHCRIVAIRENSDAGILFFTQRASRKTQEIADNPHASMTLWLPLQQREVVIEGMICALSQKENEHYWSLRPREMQLRFYAYAPTSGQPLQSLHALEVRYKECAEMFSGKDVPMSESYCGFRLVPDTYIFYTLNDQAFSDVIRYKREKTKWVTEIISP